MTNSDVIKSISYDQSEILNNILKLYNSGSPIDFDPTYSRGNFYKNGIVKTPGVIGDINPQRSGVIQLDVRYLPYKEETFKCICFDPPFLASSGSAKYKKCMQNRFGSFGNIYALYEFYNQSLLELYRVLDNRGILIVKCQDVVNGRKQYLSHVHIINIANALGLYCIDLFILLAKSRLLGPGKNQLHARKYHCYFLVLKKKKSRRA